MYINRPWEWRMLIEGQKYEGMHNEDLKSQVSETVTHSSFDV